MAEHPTEREIENLKTILGNAVLALERWMDEHPVYATQRDYDIINRARQTLIDHRRAVR